MIEFRAEAGAGVAMLWFSGIQARKDIICAADALIESIKRYNGIRLLFDWSNVRGWACEATSLPVDEWVATASLIERAVILHHHRWNRQAAWLAALLRCGNADVRSWHLEQAEAAQSWLIASPGKSAPL